jgi:O-antigen biosynthesis protein WbqV
VITLAGRVPEAEIPITFTGLRPGEKLHERLMTDDEAKSARLFCEGVRAVDGAAPPDDLDERLDALAGAAGAADRSRILELLTAFVVDYVPSPAMGASGSGEIPLAVTLEPGHRPN